MSENLQIQPPDRIEGHDEQVYFLREVDELHACQKAIRPADAERVHDGAGEGDPTTMPEVRHRLAQGPHSGHRSSATGVADRRTIGHARGVCAVPVTLMVRSSRKAKWREHGVYATRDEAWLAITALGGHAAHVWLRENPAAGDVLTAGHGPRNPGVRTPDPPESVGSSGDFSGLTPTRIA